MPDIIDFQFREAIAARTQLSKFFRSESPPGLEDRETINHEYFTKSLTKIYVGLCECCARPRKDCERPNLGRSHKDNQPALPNRFALLGLHDSDDGFDPTFTQAGRQCNECARDIQAAVTESSTTPRLVDDHLGDAFDLCEKIQKICDLQRVALAVWEQAAQGTTPVTLAAFITHAAFAAFEDIEQRLKILCNISSPDVLRSKFVQINHDLETSQDVGNEMDSSKTRQVEALKEAWDLLSECKQDHQDRDSDEKFCTVPRPSQIVLRRGSDSAPMDHECLSMLLHNIERHVKTRCRPTCIVRLGTPVYADVGYFLTHKEDSSNSLRCSFGLHLLLETYKSYLLASPRGCTPSCCRLQALRFAQEAVPYMGAVLEDSSMPCRCCHTLAFHLQNLHLDFKAFLGEKVFDLYFQSPWVSGSHILEMLELLFFYGLRLFSYRHYVGSVVHVYNVLRECTGLVSIPLLEKLCDTFSDILFPGGRPRRSFKACCFRYMGGRLRFDPHASHHRSGSHKVCIPPRAAKATAGFPLQKEANDARFEYRKISLLHYIKERGYHLDHSLWDRVYAITNTKKDAPSSGKGTKRHHHQCSHSEEHAHPKHDSSQPHRLDSLHDALLPEFTGPFPIAKVNFFAVYLSCIRIVSLISDRTHQAGEPKAPTGQNCLCFLDAMLDAADRYKENEHKMQLFGCRELVKICGESMLEVLGGKDVEEFLWKGL
ncbi:hypothetical protein EPUS_06303 [Endocarpon pusillum Z07020]|uniref:DUF6604 domain-containing protein n=1 Tax=Endocarpon pusillum (strain Z07020 / HMAS-L-300199) TaxID=1263415 RepID=U1I1F1_ENDPU|nr:uncharacterized protein EPUS_06303 [Endocarpon pusillum Z07020]ERF77085.1 hypothetical protein EPUS_06303 [Endocarpon pusillum Z07020]